jgi:arsenate reductase
MKPPPIRVLVLCTGNSARSIIAEYLLRQKGAGRFETSSAGSKPTGRVNPLAIWVLNEHYGIDASPARSKSWDEFKMATFDLVMTVCDHAKESCPIFPGAPINAHFGSPDPAALEGPEEAKKQLFVQVAAQIARRIDRLCALPPGQWDAKNIRAIGES